MKWKKDMKPYRKLFIRKSNKTLKKGAFYIPYKSESIKLNEKQDRRKKLTQEQKQKIIDLYSTGKFSLNKIANMFGVSKKTVLLIVNPESAANAKRYRKDNWKQWQRKGEEWNAIQREHRHYKQELYLNGELTDDGSEL